MKYTTLHSLSAIVSLTALVSLGVIWQGQTSSVQSRPPTASALASTCDRGIPISSLPVSITQPGQWFLTNSLVGPPGVSAITIAVDDVTLDLNGMQLSGTVSSIHGVEILPGVDSVTIRDGFIRGFGGSGVFGSLSRNVRVLEVAAESNVQQGFVLGANAEIRSSSSHANGSDGFGAGDGSRFVECTATSNGGIGINGAPRSVVQGCIALDNTSQGISLTSDATVTGCAARDNGLSGFSLTSGGLIADCQASGNGDAGITLGDSCVARANFCHANGDGTTLAGITALQSNCIVDSNHLVENDIGLDIPNGGNYYTRNYSAGNTTGYIVAPFNLGYPPTSGLTSNQPWYNWLD